MSFNLAGKRVLLTGASSGIGRALALALSAKKARLMVLARNGQKLEALVQHLRDKQIIAEFVVCDITNSADRQRAYQLTLEKFGGIDVLINNAGIGAWGHFQTSSESINREIFEVNFFAPMELIRLCTPLLARSDSPMVVNVTSMCGRRGMPAWPEYSASKFACVAMSEALRAEYVRFGIHVLCVVPGLTKSEYNQHLIRNEGRAEIPFDKGMEPSFVADKIILAMERGSREIVLGSEAKWMLFFNRFTPKLLNWLIARKIKKLYASEKR